jgi:hypothetical protein
MSRRYGANVKLKEFEIITPGEAKRGEVGYGLGYLFG